jgi:uncharacterized membrane protein
MTDTSPDPFDRDNMPFVAPCRNLSTFAPFRWLRLGIADYRRAPRLSLVYGIFMAAIIAAVALLAWTYGSYWFMLAMLGGFVFLAPLTCIGLYAISAQIEREQEPSMSQSLSEALRRHFGNELVFALVLLIIFMVWARAGIMVSIFFPADANPTPKELFGYLAIGSTVGAVFAIVTFSASAFSLPMIMHRDVDSVTAIVTSINAVLRNKRAMLVWLALIMLGLLIGTATLFVGLVVILPVIGYAAWHGYLETIDASAFPRHSGGITSTPRKNPV